MRAAKRLGVPSLVKLGTAGQNLDFYSLERKKFVWGKVAAQEIARDATRIVSISKEMYDDTRAFGIPEPRCQLIPNGVEPVTPITAEERASLRAELGVLPGERLLLFVGRMERQKNVETLLTAGADANATLPSGETVLMTASRTGSATAVRGLVAHGARIDAQEHTRGQTALMWAVAQGHAEVVSALVELGADDVLCGEGLDFQAAVGRITSGEGADLVVDFLGGGFFEWTPLSPKSRVSLMFPTCARHAVWLVWKTAVGHPHTVGTDRPGQWHLQEQLSLPVKLGLVYWD